MINLRYVNSVRDTSGYSNAGRNYISALLDTNEIDLTVEAASFEVSKTSHGALLDRIEPYIGRPLDYKIQIVHLTPENYPIYIQPGVYNIAYTVWETDKLPDQWVPLCNLMDEIWVPSQWNVEVFRNSGVTKPIYKIPHCITKPSIQPHNMTVSIEDDKFVFYTIAQWTQRKNPVALLKAYLTEFKHDENVVLALKTYRLDTSMKEQELIKRDIASLKQSLRLENYPPLIFFGNLFPAELMDAFHKRGDCFVLPHRGEGFGIPFAESFLYENPVIGTSYSGNMEFMNSDNSYLVDYQIEPVSGMLFPNYNGGMNWAGPDISHLKNLMRQVYEDLPAAQEKAKIGKAFVEENYNTDAIGKMMVDRIKEILQT